MVFLWFSYGFHPPLTSRHLPSARHLPNGPRSRRLTFSAEATWEPARGFIESNLVGISNIWNIYILWTFLWNIYMEYLISVEFSMEYLWNIMVNIYDIYIYNDWLVIEPPHLKNMRTHQLG